jgi:hypothetical protein
MESLQGWKEKLLSKVGKEILIKVVAQAIPTYAMSCFDLTKTLCDDIGTMIGRFVGLNRTRKIKCIGCPGSVYAIGRRKGVWVSGISIFSTWPCWLAKDGVLYKN